MSFSRQILIFICIWGLLIYVFLVKLSPGSSAAKDSDELERLNQALLYLERSKAIDADLRRLLDEYVSDAASADQKTELLKQIGARFQDASSGAGYGTGGSKGVPSLEYEQMRRRVTTNVGELWSFMHSELGKIEKSMKNEFESQQSLKQMKGLVDMAREHKR
jgi:glycoprotein 6-alpha-L-fucosyltransferase